MSWIYSKGDLTFSGKSRLGGGSYKDATVLAQTVNSLSIAGFHLGSLRL